MRRSVEDSAAPAATKKGVIHTEGPFKVTGGLEITLKKENTHTHSEL